MSNAFVELRSAFVAVLDHAITGLDAHAELFSASPAQLSGGVPSAADAPGSLPVVERWLHEALSLAEKSPSPVRELARALRVAAPDMAWQRAYADLDSTPDLELPVQGLG